MCLEDVGWGRGRTPSRLRVWLLGRRVSGKSATAPLIWTWGNGDSILEIASSQTPSLGNVGGDLLGVLVDAKVGQEVDPSLAVGKSCTIVVKDFGLRHEFTITVDGRTATVCNGGKFIGTDELADER